MASSALRVAVIAGVPQAVRLLDALRALEGACPLRVVALAGADRHDARLRDAIAPWDPALYVRADEFLAQEAVDVCLVASALPQRHAHAEAALYAGCHVMVTAPLALTVRAGARVVRAAQESNRLLAVLGAGRSSRHAHMLRWAVGSECLGKLRYVLDIAFGEDDISPNLCAGADARSHDRLHGGGLVLARTVRDLAFLRFTCGDIIAVSGQEACLEPERVLRGASGRVSQRFACHAEDTVCAHLAFAGNAAGQYLRSWSGRGFTLPPRFTVWAEDGAIYDVTLIGERGAPSDLEDAWKQHVGPAEIERLFPGGTTDSLHLELGGFIAQAACFGGGGQHLLPCNGRDALRDLATAWALSESHAAGARLAVAEVETLKVETAQRPLNIRWKID